MAITREQMERILAECGIPMASPDDPIYREGPTAIFVSRLPRKPAGKESTDEEE